jgi:hypothetical protein
MAVGDMDGDGHPDVVVSNFLFSAAGLSVLRNLGDGTYGPPQIVSQPFGKSVAEVALADIDMDGDLDVLATVPDVNGLSNELAFYRNLGNGLLARRATPFVTGPGPRGLVVADFSGDGFPDVVTADYGYVAGNNPTVSLLTHNGQVGAAAGFLAPVSFTVGPRPERVAAADFNADGRLDLVVTRTSSTGYPVAIASVLFNNGAGGFSAPVEYTPVPSPSWGTTAVAVADIDNDGDVDIITGTRVDSGSISNGVVAVMKNNGNGTFGAAQAYPFENYVSGPTALATGDLNGDGFLDILASSGGGGANDGYHVLLNNRTGGFLPAIRYEAAKDPIDVACADTDGDGDLDVLTLARDSALITVHPNPGNGIFAVLPRYDVGSLSQALDAADIDRDGDIDIVTTDRDLYDGTTNIYVLRNQGGGNFDPAEVYIPHPLRVKDVKLRDLNGDGYPDLVLGPGDQADPAHLVTALNQGDGTFAPAVATATFSCGYGRVEAADFDNDGDNDVVLTEEAGCPSVPIPRIFLFRNDGTGALSQLPPIHSYDGFATGIAVSDLNFDGNIDLVSSVAAGIGVFLGNGDLTFQESVVSGAPTYEFALADMDLDGHLDAVVIPSPPSWGTYFVGVSFGNADGTFKPPVTYPGASGLEGAFRVSNDITTSDINGDGYPDVVTTNNAPNDITLFLNQGNGALGPKQHYGAGHAAHVAFFADFTGDGVPDVAPIISLPPGGFASAVVILRGLADQPQPAPAARRSTHWIGTEAEDTWTSDSLELKSDAPSSQVANAAVQPVHQDKTLLRRRRPLSEMVRTISASVVGNEWDNRMAV